MTHGFPHPVYRFSVLLLTLVLFFGFGFGSLASAADRYLVDHWETIDGDTLRARISLGFGVIIQKNIRLKDVCAAELYSQTGALAEDVLNAVLGGAKPPIRFEVAGAESYGRLVGRLYDADGNDLNARVQARLVAVGANGGRGVCP